MITSSSSREPLASVRLARSALRLWPTRTWTIAVVSSVLVALLVGLATVLIPNPVFGRDIPPVWWNYPVWLVTSALTGMLIATYLGRRSQVLTGGDDTSDAESDRPSRLGLAGTVIAWFAVGCPVCNKIALVALGYSGALTWFAPLQPVLAVAALGLTSVALVVRLRGEVACPVPRVREKVTA